MHTYRARLEEWLRRTDAGQARMLDARFLADKAGAGHDFASPAFLQALSDMSVNGPLEPWGVIFDADGEHVIETEDLAEYAETGVLIHPRSGMEVADPENALVRYWSLRPDHVWAPPDPAVGVGERSVRVLSKSRAYDGFFKIDRYDLEQTSGGRAFRMRREVFSRGKAAAILLYDPVLDQVLTVEEFRIGYLAAGFPAEDSFSMGPIAGIVDPGESPEAAALREASEEAGVTVREDDIVLRMDIAPSPGGSDEMVSLFLATADLSRVEPGRTFGQAGEAEMTWRHVMAREDALRMVTERPCSGHLTSLVMRLQVALLTPGPDRDRLLSSGTAPLESLAADVIAKAVRARDIDPQDDVMNPVARSGLQEDTDWPGTSSVKLDELRRLTLRMLDDAMTSRRSDPKTLQDQK